MSRRLGPADPLKELHKAAALIQTQLRTAINTKQLDALATYYTHEEPMVRGVPFCVALARSTFMFHLQMERVPEADAELYIPLIEKVVEKISSDHHPFIATVLRHDVFGLGATGGHAIVLLPVPQFNALSFLACELAIRDISPTAVSTAWVQRLRQYAASSSPLVNLRSQLLLVRITRRREDLQGTHSRQHAAQDMAELKSIIQSSPTKMNLDLLLLCYERLQRQVPDPEKGTGHDRALAILSSNLFLKLRSPIRRHYLETYLYPSLNSPDMLGLLDNEETRRYLSTLLLRQCTPGMQPGNPFYMCQLAIVQHSLAEPNIGAMELATLMDGQMPNTAYFMSALAVDPRMHADTFVSIIMLLTRSAAHIMAGREPSSDAIVGVLPRDSLSQMAYNIIFCLREVVRHCALTATKRAGDLLQLLRAGVSQETVYALGSFAKQAFEGRCDVSIEPQLLCAELGMILHNHDVSPAMDTCLHYFKKAASLCSQCGTQCSSSLVCPVSGDIHLEDRAALSRILSTVSDCAGNEPVQSKMVELLRSPATQMLPATHFFLYHLISNTGQHRAGLLAALEPHIRSILLLVSDADAVNTVPSDIRASILVVHVKLVNYFPQDPLQLQSTIRLIASLALRCEHDALALYWVAHRLLRMGKANVELLAIDPQETHYGQEVPGTAPSSYAAADNAQMLLHMLTMAHGYNDATRKLVGASVCKLIQDFNVQAPNIVSSLLGPIGFLPNSPSSAAMFAFPCSPESTFWHFVLVQMRKSAPARTSFIATATRSVSSRFRNDSPATAVSIGHPDPSTDLFAIAFFSCMRRSALMAGLVTHLVSTWVRMKGHKPGKFVCLLNMCCQTTLALMREEEDQILPTAGEKIIFDEAIAKGIQAVREASVEAQRLLPLLGENPPFQQILNRIIRSSNVISGNTNPMPDREIPSMPLDNEVFDSEFGAAFNEESMALQLAQVENPDDDGLFNDDNDGPEGDEDHGYMPADPHRDTSAYRPTANDARSTQPVSTLSTRSATSTASTLARSTQHNTTVSSKGTTQYSSNPTTLDTIVASSGNSSSGAPAPGWPAINGHTSVHRPMVLDIRPPVDMPMPGQVRDEASQTSPHDEGRGSVHSSLRDTATGTLTDEDDEPDQNLPLLQAHSKAFVASSALSDYLWSRQPRDSAKGEFAGWAGEAAPLELNLLVQENNNADYNVPHTRQRQPTVNTSIQGVLAHPIPSSSLAHTPMSAAQMTAFRGSGNKRPRDDANTPNQPVLGTPWRAGIDSAKNELRDILSGFNQANANNNVNNQSMPNHSGPYLPLPRNQAEHERNMAMYYGSETAVYNYDNGSMAQHGGGAPHPHSMAPTSMAQGSMHPSMAQVYHASVAPTAVVDDSGSSARAQTMTVFAHSASMPAQALQQPFQQPPPRFLFEHQRSGDAFREVRQVMGLANPNTAHTFSGRARKEPISSNAMYSIGQRQREANDDFAML